MDFRRAVSSAYYALFHAVTLAAAGLLASSDPRLEITRAFNHRDLKTVATWVAGGTPPEAVATAVEALRGDERVRQVAASLEQLIANREDADYNHSATFSQRDAIVAIKDATEAVRIAGSANFTASPAGRLFLGLIALRASGLR